MAQFEEKKFNIRELKGISGKNIEEHLKLYSGYVKNTNLVNQKLYELWTEDPEKNTYLINELVRRFSFEYNGMRNHEIYFDLLSDGSSELKDGELKNAIEESYGTVETFIKYFKTLAMIRGIGWAMLWFDKKENKLLTSWVDEQHLGQLQGCSPIIALDMWEHSYVSDYEPSGKKQYVEDFFTNLNWEKVQRNFLSAKN